MTMLAAGERRQGGGEGKGNSCFLHDLVLASNLSLDINNGALVGPLNDSDIS